MVYAISRPLTPTTDCIKRPQGQLATQIAEVNALRDAVAAAEAEAQVCILCICVYMCMDRGLMRSIQARS